MIERLAGRERLDHDGPQHAVEGRRVEDPVEIRAAAARTAGPTVGGGAAGTARTLPRRATHAQTESSTAEHRDRRPAVQASLARLLTSAYLISSSALHGLVEVEASTLAAPGSPGARREHVGADLAEGHALLLLPLVELDDDDSGRRIEARLGLVGRREERLGAQVAEPRQERVDLSSRPRPSPRAAPAATSPARPCPGPSTFSKASVSLPRVISIRLARERPELEQVLAPVGRRPASSGRRPGSTRR